MKTGKGLAEYAIAQLGKPYWWGTFGQIAGPSLLAAKRSQYPEQFATSDFESQFGQKVHDCVGLIKGYLWSETPDGVPYYNSAQDVAVAGLYAQCDKKGALNTIPEIPGVCVFNASLGHVGVYIGDGAVVEAMGHKWGVVKTGLHDRNWSNWGMPTWISYTDGGPGVPIPHARPTYYYKVPLPLLKPGMESPYVNGVQRSLAMLGYDVHDTGIMDAETDSAVKDIQRKAGKLVDGEIGGETWPLILAHK